jgi:hypothetical protein
MAQRSKRANKMRNKKTQKQGRSKKGGVGWQLLAAPIVFFSALFSALRDSPQQSLTTGSYSGLQLISSADLKDMIDAIPMSPAQKSAVNIKLPVYDFITDTDGKQIEIPDFLTKIEAPQRFLWVSGMTPKIANIVYNFGKSVNIYEDPYIVRQGVEPLVFPGNIVFVNQPGYVNDNLFNGIMGALIPISNFVPEKVTLGEIEETIYKGFIKNGVSTDYELLGSGGSRKRRPKTKRRSKRY